MRRQGSLAVLVLSGLLALFGWACSGSEDVLSDAPAEESVPVAAPSSVDRAIKVGPAFVTVNPRAWDDPQEPWLIHTTDMVNWSSLPDPPGEVGSVGLGAIGDQLVVLGMACEGASEPEFCSDRNAEGNETATAPLEAWLLDLDSKKYQQLDLPEGVRAEAESLVASTTGTSAASLSSSEGQLLVSEDGTVPLDSASVDLQGGLGFELVGDRLVVVKASGSKPPAEFGPNAAPPDPGDFRVESIQTVPTSDISAEPSTLRVPEEFPDVLPFLTPTEAIWIDSTQEHVVNLDSAEVSIEPLPPEVQSLAGVVTPTGGRDGLADGDGSLYLTPDPLYAPPAAKLGVAQRDANGTWSVISTEPIPSGLPLVAGSGLFVLGPGSTISQIGT